jgi:hypothetical protein
VVEVGFLIEGGNGAVLAKATKNKKEKIVKTSFSLDECLLMALFGCTPEQKVQLDLQNAANEAAQLKKDWAEARHIAERANEEGLMGAKWQPALIYGRGCAVPTPFGQEGVVAQFFGEELGYFSPSDYDRENTELATAE